MSPEVMTITMLFAVLVGVFLGFPIAFTLGGMGLAFGAIFWGPQTIPLLAARAFSVYNNYTYVAIPLFIFMGTMLDASGVADTAFGVLNQWLKKFKGGLGVGTIILCTIFAACTGVVGASVTAMGLLALPAMLRRGYKHSLACGIICAGGSLGILIPPSIMLVLFGPMANVSVVKLFSAAIIPGLGLSALYIVYTIIYTRVKKDAIVETPENEEQEVHYTAIDGIKAFLPFLFLIFMVLGMILFGVCSPTEAAAAGSFGAILLAAAYRKINMKVLVNAGLSSLKISAMVMFIATGANIFTSVFFGVGGNRVMTNFFMGLDIGAWGTLASVLLLVFILGMLIDWVGILLIVIPIFMPILNAYGFDTLWSSMMIIVMLQTSFLTPPFAHALFYIRGVAPPEVSTASIYRGAVPFILIIIFMIIMMGFFPGITTWLPNRI
ncbi:MAG: TRAP transporter large permease subunit [Deltaproteobacteria bacterium]|jgi:tripartite ATP-independent transporter DctM subunit|nr:TRAP transporter large permease subunit [Deltaproteobacteria bacterium]